MLYKVNNFTFILFIFFVYHCIVCAQVIDNSNRISRQKCKEYSSAANSCKFNKNNGDIVVENGEFPHMVFLEHKIEGKTMWTCNGVLISDQFALITAICAEYKTSNTVLKVHFGILDYEKINETQNTQQQQQHVAQIIIHPEYRKNEKYNDIALVKFVHSVKLNTYVRPACLPELNEKPWKSFILTGYEIFANKKKTYLTNYKNIEEVPHEECNDYYDKVKNLPHGIDIDTHFCAGPYDVVCTFLSGAPLQTLDDDIPCMYDVHAIISFGKPCMTKAPTVFTKIAPYIDWIEENVWP